MVAEHQHVMTQQQQTEQERFRLGEWAIQQGMQGVLSPRLNQYHKQVPTIKQRVFMCLPVREALFGGSVGPGKSSGLLMDALQYVDIPGYHALILRKSFADLSLPGALMDRAKEWLYETDAKWKDKEHSWEFPSKATLTFGYLDNVSDKYRYQSSEFHYIGFDELTQFREEDYRYMFSRLRKLKTSPIPIRMRGATNPGGFGHCVPFGELLTPGGWKPIQDINIGEFVSSMDDVGNMVFQPVKQIFSYNVNNVDLLSFESSTHTIIATPEHKIIRVTETKTKQERKFNPPSEIKFSDISEVTRTIHAPEKWNGSFINHVSVKDSDRKKKLKQPDTMTGNQFCCFMGWFLSEGVVIDRDKAFKICQTKQFQKDMIRNLLDEIGFVYGENKTGFLIHCSMWYEYLKQFGKCREKFIPAIIQNATTEQIALFWETAMHGDGYIAEKGTKTYYTTSKQLSDDMQILGMKLGFDVKVFSRQRKNRTGLSYSVVFRKNRFGWMEKKKVQQTKHTGKVYCIGVPNHRFFIRQNGTIWLSGNSWVYQRFFVEGAKAGRVFLPARLSDNPHVDAEDYIKSLSELDPITLAQLLAGDWNVRVSTGFFQRQWFNIVANGPIAFGLRWVRFWDFANKTKDENDFTAGALTTATPDGHTYLRDMVHGKWEAPDAIEIVYQTACSDPDGTEIYIEDTANGTAIAQTIMRQNRFRRYKIKTIPIAKDKQTRASGWASRAKAGYFNLVQGAWITGFLDECMTFGQAKAKDDRIDATSGSYLAHTETEDRTLHGRR